MKLNELKINFLGDSITEGYGVARSENIFTNVIAAKTGAICRNYGISGTRIALQQRPSVNAPHHDLYFVGRVEEMDEDADAVVVFGGTNDFGHGDAKLGTMADRTAETFYGALHCLCQKLIARYPGKPIVFMTPLHRISEDATEKELYGLPEETDLAGYVDIVKEVARYYSLPVLDLFAMSGLQPRVPVIRERFMPDGLHPNDAGHAILAERIIAFLESL